jgi:hypothetical protein
MSLSRSNAETTTAGEESTTLGGPDNTASSASAAPSSPLPPVAEPAPKQIGPFFQKPQPVVAGKMAENLMQVLKR